MEINGKTAVVARNEDIDLEQLQASMVDVVELELIRPIETGGEERTTLTFEEPTGKHVEMMSKAGSAKAAAEMSFRVLGECVGLAPEEVKNLRSRDLTRLGQVLKYFLPDSQPGVI
ncbi:phage tail assembly protein [Arhodomonas aquaeolei]|uniref:phage tail assembly protein n=1 Tax=Arhodomonas aquaeolei TaxID=2369 RepID=UPI00216851C8|nr:phage tail assembly protein [Arhodomonas aquaeolei]MCS4503899.1 phage tail assembly protein [Arhodomonas aquaeolei]